MFSTLPEVLPAFMYGIAANAGQERLQLIQIDAGPVIVVST